MELQNKVAIVTGGASGQGKATVQLFAEEGASVAFVDVNEQAGKELEESLTNEGYQVVFYNQDVSEEEGVKRVVEDVQGRFGRIDVLFNNAGIGFGAKYDMGSAEETDSFNWGKVLEINLNSVFFFTKYTVPIMREQQSGSIINNASTAALMGQPGADAYTASKGAIVALTRSWAVGYGAENIRVNAIAPGTIDTQMVTNITQGNKEVEAEIAKGNPTGRLGKPEEIAGTALFLASDKSTYVNGVTIPVDGGMVAG
ncbi:SDR family NAD(P)-dependent oxidoreductase [Oceanobacillus halotolerans]|uniref:SDR family NAD(P)-dependent oxidoreductase n=1 Tax=Oceanobacillus halotolerans TaxID=2663380 RepID=UPI0013DB4106|nr:glucose 1-dehydrogenase [Oceanobacillus halotolerans]